MHDFAEEGIQVLKGRFGPYIKKGKDNYKIPKGTDATTLTLEEVLEIIKAAPAPKKSAAKTAKKAPKKK
ncbi:MAG: hypothetical protein M9931_05755 [Chitinophagales bacterium]|nr:hypothetical protein [Chitinophagales bacterium]